MIQTLSSTMRHGERRFNVTFTGQSGSWQCKLSGDNERAVLDKYGHLVGLGAGLLLSHKSLRNRVASEDIRPTRIAKLAVV